MSDASEMNRISKAAVNVFAVVALAFLCSPSLQTPGTSTTPLRNHQQQVAHKGKIGFCILAKIPTKIGIRKASAQQPVQFLDPVGDGLSRLSSFARSVYATAIHCGVAPGNSTFRERAPPV